MHAVHFPWPGPSDPRSCLIFFLPPLLNRIFSLFGGRHPCGPAPSPPVTRWEPSISTPMPPRAAWPRYAGAGSLAEICRRGLLVPEPRLLHLTVARIPKKNGRPGHPLAVLRNELPRYEKAILKVAQRSAIDPLLLIALIHHESGFDPMAVSRTGMRARPRRTHPAVQRYGGQPDRNARDHADHPGQGPGIGTATGTATGNGTG